MKTKDQKKTFKDENKIGMKLNYAKAAKGWKNKAPKSKSERQDLFNKCGPNSFLKPESFSYPIVPINQPSCAPSCKGIVSAIMRAREWNDNATLEQATIKFKDYNCKEEFKTLK